MNQQEELQRQRFLSSMPYAEYKQHFPKMTPQIRPIQPKFYENIKIPELYLPPSNYQGCENGKVELNSVIFYNENKVQDTKNFRKKSENINDRQIFTYLQIRNNK